MLLLMQYYDLWLKRWNQTIIVYMHLFFIYFHKSDYFVIVFQERAMAKAIIFMRRVGSQSLILVSNQ
jgi:hypothetical protein